MANISAHTFIKGWDTDTDYGYLSNQSYIDAANFRLTSTSGNTNGALENVVGNTPWSIEVLGTDYELRDALSSSTVLNSSSWYMVGHVDIIGTLILFITENTTDPTAGGNNWIVKVEYDSDEITSITKLYTSTSLNFAKSYPIKAVGRYERSDIQKIYWVDGYNSVRFANIADTGLSSQSVDKFDLFSNVSFGDISYVDTISGTIQSGKVQYAYQLYDDYGSETPFSPPSEVFNAIAEEDSLGTGFKIAISDLDTTFDKIRLVSLYYDTLNTLPTVRIVYEGKITSSIQFFTDTGFTLGELTYEEFSILGNTDLVAEEIAVKNNYLFVANTTEESFDVLYDTRAYRFDNTPKARLYNSDLTTFDDITTTNWATYDAISTNNPNGTHDCINLYNDPDNSFSNQYKFQSNGSTLGAEGPNVIIEVSSSTTAKIDIDTVGSTTEYISGDEFATVQYAAQYTGYKRGEVYRFGAVLLNEKGQRSPVKWVCDFKMPTFEDSADFNVADYDSGNNKTVGNSIGISISFRNIPSEVTAIEIVRVKRQSEDRSRVAQGLVSYGLLDDTYTPDRYYGTLVPALKSFTDGDTINFTTSDNLGLFFSPEVSFGNTINYSTGDKLVLSGILTEITHWDQADITYNTDLNDAHILKYKEAGQAFSTNSDQVIIEALEKVVPNSNSDIVREYDIGTLAYKYRHIGSAQEGVNDFNLLGTSLVCQFPATVPFTSANGNLGESGGFPEVYLVDYVRNIFDSQYGGPSFSDRLNNEYISTGRLIIDGNGGFSHTSSYFSREVVFGGDTFVNMFDCLYGAYDSESTTANGFKSFVNLFFPVESSINLALRSDEPFSSIYNVDGAYLLQERPGLYQTASGVEFEFPEKLYQYNTVYSQENTGVTHFVNNVYEQEEGYETRVYVSDKKFNGEITDSWLKFRINNYLDTDIQYGPIVNLEFYKNELLFWQTKAFGILPVEQRSLINDNAPGTLALGTGDVLGRYDYLSIDSGSQSKFGIVKSNAGVYWYDQYNTALFRYAGSLQPINKLNGLDSYFETSLDSNVTMVGVYDYKYNDIIFSFVKSQFSTGEFVQRCLLFNELFDVFVGRLNTSPVYFIQLFDNRYIGINDNFFKFYEYNTGDYCEFEETVYDSTITLVDNVSYPQIKVYDNLEYFSRSTNSTGANIFNDTFYKLRVHNDYQNTAEWSLQVDATKNNSTRILPVERRERNFTLAIPRNALTVPQASNPNPLSSSLNTTTQFRERIRGNYAVMQFKYSNTNNYKFSVPFINVIYRISPR